MEVLLRKASTLVRACSQAAAKVDVDAMLMLSPYSHASSNHEKLLSTASHALTTNLSEVIELHRTETAIRKLIGEANAETVSPLLAERNFLNSCEKAITAVLDALKKDDNRRGRIYRDNSSVRVEHDAALVRTTLQTLNTRSSTTTTGEIPEVEVPALTQAAVEYWENELATIRRKRTDLMDELAAANLSKKIKLPENVVAVLRRYKIVE